uniref:Uncharacterized protein n=1 Tax=Siphoviridae sp. ct7es18 TaxID=2826166 RepID=A0A8S5MHN7_9CAUD|nr:MAG TPA: hypothetical protein [Siphoviridae sp. ct7es18]
MQDTFAAKSGAWGLPMRRFYWLSELSNQVQQEAGSNSHKS